MTIVYASCVLLFCVLLSPPHLWDWPDLGDGGMKKEWSDTDRERHREAGISAQGALVEF